MFVKRHPYIPNCLLCIHLHTYIKKSINESKKEMFVKIHRNPPKCLCGSTYGVATISGLLKMIGWQHVVFFIGLFCKRDLSF